MALDSGPPTGVGPYYENHGYQPENFYPLQPPAAPGAYPAYPAQHYPSPVPQYVPTVLTHASTPAIHQQPNPPSGTVRTSSRTLFALIAYNEAGVSRSTFSSGLSAPTSSTANYPTSISLLSLPGLASLRVPFSSPSSGSELLGFQGPGCWVLPPAQAGLSDPYGLQRPPSSGNSPIPAVAAPPSLTFTDGLLCCFLTAWLIGASTP